MMVRNQEHAHNLSWAGVDAWLIVFVSVHYHRSHQFRYFVTISEISCLSDLVCPASKPWGIMYDIMEISATKFSANISWRAPNNTYQREIIRYVVSIDIEGEDLDGIQSVRKYVSYLLSFVLL